MALCWECNMMPFWEKKGKGMKGEMKFFMRSGGICFHVIFSMWLSSSCFFFSSQRQQNVSLDLTRNLFEACRDWEYRILFRTFDVHWAVVLFLCQAMFTLSSFLFPLQTAVSLFLTFSCNCYCFLFSFSFPDNILGFRKFAYPTSMGLNLMQE